MIANPGIPVSTHAERNMKMLCYYLRYYAGVSRTPSINGITLLLVREYESYAEWETNHKDVEPPTLNDKDWPRTIESIKGWLRGCLGQEKSPLAYIVRDELAVPAEATDPMTSYNSKQEELI